MKSLKFLSNYNSNMNKASLKKLSKSQLIKLLMKQDNNTPVIQKRKPIPTPRKSVKEMVKRYEENIILPPMQFRDNYKPVPSVRTVKKPVPTPRTVIKQIDKALKGFVKSYEINIRNERDPLVQMQNTRNGVERQVTTLLNEMKGLKYIETLQVTFEKISSNIIIEKSAYFNSASQTIINQMEINNALQMSKQNILTKRTFCFKYVFFFIKPDKSTKISLKRVRFVMINDLRYFS